MAYKGKFKEKWEAFKKKIESSDPILEKLNIRLTMLHAKRFAEEIPENKLKWVEALSYAIEDILGAINGAIKRHEAKKSWWERWGKRILRAGECALIIVAGIFVKKLPV